jgi:hypothetical protein
MLSHPYTSPLSRSLFSIHFCFIYECIFPLAAISHRSLCTLTHSQARVCGIDLHSYRLPSSARAPALSAASPGDPMQCTFDVERLAVECVRVWGAVLSLFSPCVCRVFLRFCEHMLHLLSLRHTHNVSLSLHFSIYLSIYLSIYQSIYLSMYLLSLSSLSLSPSISAVASSIPAFQRTARVGASCERGRESVRRTRPGRHAIPTRIAGLCPFCF